MVARQKNILALLQPDEAGSVGVETHAGTARHTQCVCKGIVRNEHALCVAHQQVNSVVVYKPIGDYRNSTVAERGSEMGVRIRRDI